MTDGTLLFEDVDVHYTLWALFYPESYENLQQDKQGIKFVVDLLRQK
jgi:hypothetical protein